MVTRAIILVGFWGLPRLGELTLHPDHPLVFLRHRDVSFSKDGRSAKLLLRQAKTAAHSGIKFIRLHSKPNCLDPINALHEILQKIPGLPTDPLFPGRSVYILIDRHHVIDFLKANSPQEDWHWSGHSLRIGGACFQYDAGRPLRSLKRLVIWRSSVYKTYIHKYSPIIHSQTTELSTMLHL